MTPGARTAVALALGSFVLYNANVREISSQDTIPTRVLPYEVIEHGRLDLDRLFQVWPAAAPLPFWIQHVDGHYRSNYPVVPALLAVPVYAGPVLLGAGDSWVVLNALAKLAGSLFAAAVRRFSCTSLPGSWPAGRGAARRRPWRRRLSTRVATPTWAVASQGLWGHAPAQLGLAVALSRSCGRARGRRPSAWRGWPWRSWSQAVLPRRWLAFAVAAYVLRERRLGAWPLLALGGAVGIAVSGTTCGLRVAPGRVRRDRPDPRGVPRCVVGTWSAARLPGASWASSEPEPRLFVYSPVSLPGGGSRPGPRRPSGGSRPAHSRLAWREPS